MSLVTEKVKYSDVTLSCFGVALVACDIMAVAQEVVALAAAAGQAYRSFMWNSVWFGHTFAICVVYHCGHEKLLL